MLNNYEVYLACKARVAYLEKRVAELKAEKAKMEKKRQAMPLAEADQIKTLFVPEEDKSNLWMSSMILFFE